MSSKVIHNLVKRAQKGDADAFGELYSHYADDMYRFAYYYTSSKHYAEDAVSDAVMLAFENICFLKKADSFKSWLFKILFNCCKKKQKEKAMILNQTVFSSLTGLCMDQTNHLENLALEKALEQLSDEERNIIVLCFACGYKSSEIGEMLEMKSATVRSKLSRAVAKLRVSLE